MKIRRKSRHGAEVSTHSLNDIMFFLLLFFLIISTMANPNVIKVLVPEARDNGAKEGRKALQLSVDENKNYFLDGTPLSAEQLDLRLAALVRNNPDIACSISIDRNLNVQELVDVMQIGAKNNVRMYIKTTQPR